MFDYYFSGILIDKLTIILQKQLLLSSADYRNNSMPESPEGKAAITLNSSSTLSPISSMPPVTSRPLSTSGSLSGKHCYVNI